ncbi:hypothetical protein [Arthrobacter sp. PsM3]|uniref:hypothetical protein n=1 Tax=Arthrobacter sp. PsM3 TaxID=3030531 RepID=UPI00263A3E94|nr:hypothetical protein [Arthrobacter sp. PsM3]MDN4644931.1 hypothetical protein [Arthrobacter sp. PsM3]
MKKQFPHGIDITAPGGLTALMAFHRKTFGDAVMETDEEAAAKAAADAEAKAASDAAAAAKAADEKLGEGGIKALQSERARAEAAEKRATAAEAKIQAAEDAKLSDIQKAQKERDDQAAENAKLKATNARLAALAEHPVPKDYQDLVTGTDEASYLASAKKLSELHARAEGKAPKPDPVDRSGKRTGDNNPAGGSVAAGRDLYASRKKK